MEMLNKKDKPVKNKLKEITGALRKASKMLEECAKYLATLMKKIK
jgi:DNA-binding FrmR family transcriptional regulator